MHYSATLMHSLCIWVVWDTFSVPPHLSFVLFCFTIHLSHMHDQNSRFLHQSHSKRMKTDSFNHDKNICILYFYFLNKYCIRELCNVCGYLFIFINLCLLEITKSNWTLCTSDHTIKIIDIAPGLNILIESFMY